MDNKKVILIKGSDSQCYEQAIFIMKSEVKNQKPASLVREAEKIINEYVKNNNLQFPVSENARPYKKIKSRNKKFVLSENFLNICIVLTCIILAVTIYNLLIV